VAATLVALIGLAIWVGAIVLLIRRGVERGPRRPAVLSFAEFILPALFVLGFALFLVGLRFT
jgi:nitrate reductase gamma subunit